VSILRSLRKMCPEADRVMVVQREFATLSSRRKGQGVR
jgi:hypothetical protein